jgi:hypothetical protein
VEKKSKYCVRLEMRKKRMIKVCIISYKRAGERDREWSEKVHRTALPIQPYMKMYIF